MATPPIFNVATAEASPLPEESKPEDKMPNEMVTIAIAVGAVALGVIGIFALAFIAATFLTGGGFIGAPICATIALVSFCGAAFLISLCYKRSKLALALAKEEAKNTPPQNPCTFSVKPAV